MIIPAWHFAHIALALTYEGLKSSVKVDIVAGVRVGQRFNRRFLIKAHINQALEGDVDRVTNLRADGSVVGGNELAIVNREARQT